MNIKQLNKIVLNVMCCFFNSFRICCLSGSAKMQNAEGEILVTIVIAVSKCHLLFFHAKLITKLRSLYCSTIVMLTLALND